MQSYYVAVGENPKEIAAFETGANHTSYVLSTDTMPGLDRSTEITPDIASTAGKIIQPLFRKPGITKFQFGSTPQANGVRRDGVVVHFASPEAKAARKTEIENVLSLFCIKTQTDPALRLVNPLRFTKPEDLTIPNNYPVTVNGAATKIHAFERAATEIAYVLPTDTSPMPERSVAIRQDTAKTAGPVAFHIFNTGGISEVVFGTAIQADGSKRDSLSIRFKSAADKVSRTADIQLRLSQFCNQVASTGDGSLMHLVAPMRFVRETDFTDPADEYIRKGDHPHLALIKGIVHVFNKMVAEPHGGAAVLTGYGMKDDKKTVGVQLTGTCAAPVGDSPACPMSRITIEQGLQAMLTTYAKPLVDQLVIKI